MALWHEFKKQLTYMTYCQNERNAQATAQILNLDPGTVRKLMTEYHKRYSSPISDHHAQEIKSVSLETEGIISKTALMLSQKLILGQDGYKLDDVIQMYTDALIAHAIKKNGNHTRLIEQDLGMGFNSFYNIRKKLTKASSPSSEIS